MDEVFEAPEITAARQKKDRAEREARNAQRTLRKEQRDARWAERQKKRQEVEERRLYNRKTIAVRTKEQQLSQGHFDAAEYYLRGMTKADALIKAGYTVSTARKAAWTVFDREDVLRYIEQRRYGLRSKTRNIIDRIQEELMRVAFFNIGSFIEVDMETGDFIYDFTRASMEDFAAIGEVTVERVVDGTGENKNTVKRVRVKPYNKMEALNTLSRIYGILQDNVNITSGEGESIESRLAKGRARLNKPEIIDGECTEVDGPQLRRTAAS